MGRLPKFSSLLLAGSALGLLAACTEAEVVSPGSNTPITPVVIPGGGATGAFGQNNVPGAGCPAGTTQNNNVNLGDNVIRAFCQLSGNISGNVTLPANGGLPYLLNGQMFVGTDGGASGVLTIMPGAVLIGNDADNVASSGSVDALTVTRGSQIIANGTAAAPIVFTSAQDMLDNGRPDASITGRSQWGGLIVNGFAPINDCSANPGATGGTAACTKNGEGGSGLFGGDRPADNSGILRFVRIQHAGFQFSSTNELNGLALQGVGSGTVVENIEIFNNGDDGIEFFGGTVNARNLVLIGNDDDNIDWTDGWVGNLQTALVIQTGANGDNGIEGDNLTTSGNALPRSNPNISNVTLISNNRTINTNEGIQVRAGTNGRIINSIVAGFGQGLEFNAVAGAPTPVINAVAFNGNAVLGTDADDQALFNAGSANRQNVVSTLAGILPGPNESSVPALVPATALASSFFTGGQFAGAFAATDSAANNFTTGWTVGVPGAPSVTCPAGTTLQTGALPAGRSETNVCRLINPVNGNVTLTRGNLYELDGLVFVGADRGADPAAPVAGTVVTTLTVDPGVTLFSSGNLNGQDALIVSRGNQLIVNGSAAAPVVMTSREALFTNTGNSGDWNGLSINGRAPINDCSANPGAIGGSVTCVKSGEAGTGLFGGATAADNSGRLNFLRIEFAGFQFSGTNEANSLQLQGVGSGTMIDFVQTTFGADDGIEFFGGTVNVRHAIVVGAEDDAFDWTDGWVGRSQFVIVRQDARFAANDNGIEGDNLSTNATATPVSNPILSNFTLIGSQQGAASEGVQVRAGTNGQLLNSIVDNFGLGLSHTVVAGTLPVIASSVFTRNTTLANTAGLVLFNTGPNNLSFAASTLTNAPNTTTPLIRGANESSVVLTNPVPLSPFFTAVDYAGAVRDANDTWFQGWTTGL